MIEVNDRDKMSLPLILRSADVDSQIPFRGGHWRCRANPVQAGVADRARKGVRCKRKELGEGIGISMKIEERGSPFEDLEKLEFQFEAFCCSCHDWFL